MYLLTEGECLQLQVGTHTHTHRGIQRNIPLESKNIEYLLNSKDDNLRTLKADME